MGDLSQFARMPNAVNVFSLFQDPRDPTNFFAKDNPDKKALVDYFNILKSGKKAAADKKTLIDGQCNLPWLSEALWGPLPNWQRDIQQNIPR